MNNTIVTIAIIAAVVLAIMYFYNRMPRNTVVTAPPIDQTTRYYGPAPLTYRSYIQGVETPRYYYANGNGVRYVNR